MAGSVRPTQQGRGQPASAPPGQAGNPQFLERGPQGSPGTSEFAELTRAGSEQTTGEAKGPGHVSCRRRRLT